MAKLSDYFQACLELGALNGKPVPVTEAQAMERAREIARKRERAELKRKLIERGGQI